MPQLSFRLTEIEDAKLRELWCLYHVDGDNDTDKMRLFIEKLHKTLTFDKVSIEGLETPQELQDILIGLKCPIRIEHGKAYFCVNRPPKMTKLETLKICQVCKASQLNLPIGTKTETPIQIETTPKTELDKLRVPCPP